MSFRLTKLGHDQKDSQVDSIQFFVEYLDLSSKKHKVKKVSIKTNSNSPSHIFEQMEKKFPQFFKNLSEKNKNKCTSLLDQLLQLRLKGDLSEHEMKPLDKLDDEYISQIDLNKCDDLLNMKAKEFMSKSFELNRLKPGDEGYQWDVQMDFEEANESNEWDEEDD